MIHDLVDEWKSAVQSKSRGRTRYVGQPPYPDEAVLDYISELEAENARLAADLEGLPEANKNLADAATAMKTRAEQAEARLAEVTAERDALQVAALDALGLLDGTNILIPNWRDIPDDLPKDMPVIVYSPNESPKVYLCASPIPSHPPEWPRYYIPFDTSSIPTPDKEPEA